MTIWHPSAMTGAIAMAGIVLIATACQAADLPEYIGRASCATATCHGGILGTGPAWHTSASVWESRDPHARAGEKLLNETSRQIVIGLDPRAADDQDSYLSVLNQHCAGCHTTAGRWTDPVTTGRVRDLISEGVSCEACHGPASRWKKEHTLSSWETSEQLIIASGMLDTRSLLSRTDVCVRCHVGSRTKDGRIRDMNHDMIAVGHPPLHFDMHLYSEHYARTGAHWDFSNDPMVTMPSNKVLSITRGLELRVLAAAAQLSTERSQLGDRVPAPELSEYDCAACHHDLQLNGPHAQRSTTGFAIWQPWYLSEFGNHDSRDHLRMSNPSLVMAVRDLLETAAVRSGEAMNSEPPDLLSQVDQWMSAPLPDEKRDAMAGPLWLTRVERLLSRLELSDDAGMRVRELLTEFRSRNFGYQSGAATALQRLMPPPWQASDLKTIREKLKAILAEERVRNRS